MTSQDPYADAPVPPAAAVPTGSIALAGQRRAADQEQPADGPAGSAEEGGEAAARPAPAVDDDDPESTAVRRQSFLTTGALRDYAARQEASSPTAPASPAPPGTDRPEGGDRPVPPGAEQSVPPDLPAPAPTEPSPADTGVLLAGASVEPGPRSRAVAHWWAAVLSVLLTPVAWYLLADAGARLTVPDDGPWAGGELNPAALAELGGGLLVLVVVLLAARWSSVGATLTGSVVLLLGLPFLTAPAATQEALEPLLDQLRGYNDLGGNLAHHLLADGATGRLVLYGVGLLLVGVVSHGARRQGRREEKAKLDRLRNRQIAARRMAEAQRRSSAHRLERHSPR